MNIDIRINTKKNIVTLGLKLNIILLSFKGKRSRLHITTQYRTILLTRPKD